MATNKTRATGADVDSFLAASPHEADARVLCELLARLSGEPPAMWGSSIVGFGRYHYRYDSGREGDSARISFSPRAKELVLYLADDFERRDELLARLGKHRAGTACIYVKRFADVDVDVLEELIRASLAAVDERYPPI